MKGLDLRGFKKVSEDKHSSTLKHPDGHEIKLAHKSLDPKMMKGLKSLPMMDDGGPVNSVGANPKDVADFSKGANEPVNPSMGEVWQNLKDSIKPKPSNSPQPQMASGGDVKRYDVGGKTESSKDEGSDAKVPPQDDSPSSIGQFFKDLLGTSAPTPPVSGPQNPLNHPADTSDQGMRDASKNTPLPNGGMTGATLQDQIANNPGPKATIGENMANPGPAPADEDNLDAPPPPTPQDTEAPVDEDDLDAPAPPPPQAAPQAAPQAQTFQDVKTAHQSDLMNEDQAWQHDLANQHITPETYHDLFAKKDTLGKIGTIFGMLLSGAGSGLAHQPNMMLAMMNNEIEKDLDAQKASKANAQNFIRLNQSNALNQAQVKQLGTSGQLNLANAANAGMESKIKGDALSHMQMNRAAVHSLVQKVQSLPPGSPQRVQAEQTLAMMSQSVDMMNSNIADKAASMSALANFAAGSNGGTQVDPEAKFQADNRLLRMSGRDELAKDRESKHYAGIPGQASNSLTPENRSAINSGVDFDQKLNRFINWTKGHSGDLSPADINTGKALSAELQGAYRQATHGGVYKEGEQNFIGKIIDSDPTKFFNNIRVLPQLNAISNENKQRVNTLVKGMGFAGYPGVSAQAAQGSTPAGAQYKTVNGVKYMRGPNGEAIKVQ